LVRAAHCTCLSLLWVFRNVVGRSVLQWLLLCQLGHGLTVPGRHAENGQYSFTLLCIYRCRLCCRCSLLTLSWLTFSLLRSLHLWLGRLLLSGLWLLRWLSLRLLCWLSLWLLCLLHHVPRSFNSGVAWLGMAHVHRRIAVDSRLPLRIIHSIVVPMLTIGWLLLLAVLLPIHRQLLLLLLLRSRVVSRLVNELAHPLLLKLGKAGIEFVRHPCLNHVEHLVLHR
jgi:hypothetical protein